MKMRLFSLFLLLGIAWPQLSLGASSACKKQSDCEEGCADAHGVYKCLAANEVKFKNGEGNCRASLGGLTCGCAQGSCQYRLPQEFDEAKVDTNSDTNINKCNSEKSE